MGEPVDPDQMVDLRAHHLGPADRPPQHGLVHHHPDARRSGPGQQLLTAHAQRDPALGRLGRGVRIARAEQGAGVRLRLQQPVHELRLVRADLEGRLLQAQIRREPVGQDIAVRVPPAALVGLAHRLQEGVDLLLVRHAVRLEELLGVGEPEPGHLGGFHPADGGVADADGLARLLECQPGLGAQLLELLAENHAQNGGGAAPVGLRGHALPPHSGLRGRSLSRSSVNGGSMHLAHCNFQLVGCEVLLAAATVVLSSLAR